MHRPQRASRATAKVDGMSIANSRFAIAWGAAMEQQMLMTADVDSAEVMRCIDDCERCHRICLRMAMTFCLEQGGEHVEPPHLRAMLACADVCRMTADSMLAAFTLHEELCGLCARVCRDCAESCERVGDMPECVDACRQCAMSCARLSGA
jgi:hypothetical protein